MATLSTAPDRATHPRSTVRSPRTIVATLWLFATLNFLYCDVLGIMYPPDLAGFLAGDLGGIAVTETFLLGGALLMQVPLSTVLVTRVAPWRVVRIWVPVAAAFMTVVQVGSLFVGTGTTSFYAMFSATEIAAVLVAGWFAWHHRVEAPAPGPVTTEPLGA